MPDDAKEEIVNIYLEAYLLWLFGSAMFANHCSKVQTWILPYAFLLANSPIGSIPKFSWGSTVLAATYRGLSNVCTSKAKSPVLTDAQCWSSYGRTSDSRLDALVPKEMYGTIGTRMMKPMVQLWAQSGSVS